MSQTAPTLRDVARLAGVSIATVSYVLNGRHPGNKPISEATRQKVLQVVAEIGYTPNQAGRHLRRQSAERVCVVLPHLGVPYYEVICQHVAEIAGQHNYSVILSLADSQEREREVLEQLHRRLADGVIFIHPRLKSEELSRLAGTGIAVVVFSNLVSGQSFDVVKTTEEEAFYTAVRYLLEKGHRRVAFLSGTESDLSIDQRFIAYRQALQDYGIPLDEQLVTQGFANNRKAAYQNATKLFHLPEHPSAIFAGSDVAAISTVWAARDAGLRVPDDVAVIGAGNIPEGEITSPPLTTVGPAPLDFKNVAELLFSRLGDPGCQERIHLCPWKLIIRGSA